jgi:hypothetical protein
MREIFLCGVELTRHFDLLMSASKSSRQRWCHRVCLRRIATDVQKNSDRPLKLKMTRLNGSRSKEEGNAKQSFKMIHLHRLMDQHQSKQSLMNE